MKAKPENSDKKAPSAVEKKLWQKVLFVGCGRRSPASRLCVILCLHGEKPRIRSALPHQRVVRAKLYDLAVVEHGNAVAELCA